MGKQLVEKFLPILDKLRWVGSKTATEQGRRTYWVSLDQMESFRGDDAQTRVLGARAQRSEPAEADRTRAYAVFLGPDARMHRARQGYAHH